MTSPNSGNDCARSGSVSPVAVTAAVADADAISAADADADASSAAADDEVRRVFVAFDRTGGGTIEVGDLSAALVALNLRPSAQQLNNALLGFGVDPGDASGGGRGPSLSSFGFFFPLVRRRRA